MKISVIIVAFNSARQLVHCTASIYQKFGDLFPWEIIIVNNDENLDVAALPLDFSKIKLIDHKKNVGFGSGMNMGAKEAQGEFLLLLNPDTEIVTENIADVLAEFSKDEKIGIIGGGIIDKKGTGQEWSAGKELSFFDLIANNLGFSRSKAIWSGSRKIACDWVAGTVLFIKKDLFSQLGGFDQNFFMYFEDMDLCKRARDLGKKIIFFPNFKIKHGSGESYEDKRLQKKHYYDSMQYYFKKHGNFLTLAIIRFIRKYIIRK